MNTYEYCEIAMKMDQPLIDQLNKGGQTGWKFVCMAQKVNGSVRDFKSGMPKVEIMLIFERQILSDHDSKKISGI